MGCKGCDNPTSTCAIASHELQTHSTSVFLFETLDAAVGTCCSICGRQLRSAFTYHQSIRYYFQYNWYFFSLTRDGSGATFGHEVIIRPQRVSPDIVLRHQLRTNPPGIPVGMSWAMIHSILFIFPSRKSFNPDHLLDNFSMFA